jgi:hypothetical protein
VGNIVARRISGTRRVKLRDTLEIGMREKERRRDGKINEREIMR